MYHKEIHNKILNHIEKYKFATISQISNIFYYDHKNGYDEARRVLNRLYKNGRVFKYKAKGVNNQTFFYIDEKISDVYFNLHNRLLMDYYSLFFKYNLDIKYFIKEVPFAENKIRIDGILIYSFNGDNNVYAQAIQVDNTHNTNLKDIEILYSGYIQDWFGDNFDEKISPTLVVISHIKKKAQLEGINIIYLDYDFSEFVTKIVKGA